MTGVLIIKLTKLNKFHIKTYWWQRILWQNLHTTKNPYGIISYGEYSLRWAFLTAKCPSGKVFLRQKNLTAWWTSVKKRATEKSCQSLVWQQQKIKKVPLVSPLSDFAYNQSPSVKLPLRKKKHCILIFKFRSSEKRCYPT